MNLDIDCLRTFAHVANTMSFSRAGEAVRRTQATVSGQISKLETQLGRRLFVRRKGRVLHLTLDGDRLLEYASRILELNDEAYSSVSARTLSGFVRVGLPLDFFGRNLAGWLARFKSLHPMVGLEVESDQSEQLFRRASRGELDLAFFKQSTGAGHGHVVTHEELAWVGRGDGPWSVRPSLPLVLFPEGCTYRRVALATLRSHGLPFHVSFVSPSFDCLKSAVVEGLGLSVLARVLVSPPMRVVDTGLGLPSLPPVEVVYMYGSEDKPRAVTELARFLAECVTDAGPPHLAKAA
jgi:DNA-binding transcriptional LysR family regulator